MRNQLTLSSGGVPAVVSRDACFGCEHDSAIRRRRACRVTVLALGSATLGLFDLAFTLTFMQSIGMVELNPIARFMVAIGGAGQLVRFKLLMIALSSGVVYLIRSRRGAEISAWIGLLMLVLLSLYWARYTTLNEKIGAELLAQNTREAHNEASMSTFVPPGGHRWVVIVED